MLLSSSWKPPSPVCSPYTLEPLRSPPLSNGYTDSSIHDEVGAAVESYSRMCQAGNRDDEKQAGVRSTLHGSLSSHPAVSCEPPSSCSSSAFLSVAGAASSDSLSPLPQFCPAVTPPPTATLREAAPSTNGSNSSLLASLSGSSPSSYDNGTTGARTFHNSDDVIAQSSLSLSRSAVTSPFTLPGVDGERGGSPPRVEEQQQRPNPPLPLDLTLSSSSFSSTFPSFPSLPPASSLIRRRPMFGAYSSSHPLHRHSLLSPWPPSRHVPLHILADSFSSLASYAPLHSTFDEQYGNNYQPHPHSLYYHHSDTQSDSQRERQPHDDQPQQSKLKRAAREQEEQEAACENGTDHSSDRSEQNEVTFSYDSMPLPLWPTARYETPSFDQHNGQQNGQSSSVEQHTAVRKRSGASLSASYSVATRPDSGSLMNVHTPTTSVAVPLINGGSGVGSTESDRLVPTRTRVKAKRGCVVKREQQSPVQSVALSTIASSSSGRSRRSVVTGAVRAARVITALQVDTATSTNHTHPNGWALPGRSSITHNTARQTAQRRKRARSLSATSASSQPPQPPTSHSPTAEAQTSSSPTGALSPHPPLDPLVPSFVTYDPTPTHNSLKPKRYFCQLCSKGFTQKGGLINHTRIHRNERPYCCSWQGCTRAFVQKCNLTRHERVHSGEKPYQCPVEGCGKRFNRKHGLAQHLTHHQDDTYDREQVLSATRPSTADVHIKQSPVEEEQEQPQNGEDDADGNDHEHGGSDDSSGEWQNAARGHSRAAAVRMEDSHHIAAIGGDTSYGSYGMSMSALTGTPSFQMSTGRMTAGASGNEQAESHLHPYTNEHNGKSERE